MSGGGGAPHAPEEGLALVARRWGALARWLAAQPPVGAVARVGPWALEVDGVRLESAFDARAEARLQARLVPEDARAATLYGLGQGTLARELLARPALERLRVVVLAPAAARASLERCGHGWLADPRVALVRGDEPRELELPFAALPAALRLAAPACARLADLVRLELDTPHIRRHLRAQEEAWDERWRANRALVEAAGDVGALFGTLPGARVCVAAAGPTLALALERLRADRRPLVAVDAALRPLVAGGVVPGWVVSLDAHAEGMRRVFELPGGARDALRGSVLVHTPLCVREVLEGWPGPRACALPAGAWFDALARELPRARLWSSGSVLHAAVDLALRMGAREVELVGADFAHVGGRTHAAGAAWEAQDAGNGPTVESGEGRRVPTRANLIGYLRDLERYVAAHPAVRFVNASRLGARIAGCADRDEALTAGAGRASAPEVAGG